MSKLKKAEEALHSKKLTAYDFKSTSLVQVIHEDGTLHIFKYAFAETWTDADGDEWLFVYTEHNGYHCWHLDDIYQHGQYEAVETPRRDN